MRAASRNTRKRRLVTAVRILSTQGLRPCPRTARQPGLPACAVRWSFSSSALPCSPALQRRSVQPRTRSLVWISHRSEPRVRADASHLPASTGAGRARCSSALARFRVPGADGDQRSRKARTGRTRARRRLGRRCAGASEIPGGSGRRIESRHAFPAACRVYARTWSGVRRLQFPTALSPRLGDPPSCRASPGVRTSRSGELLRPTRLPFASRSSTTRRDDRTTRGRKRPRW